jgi:hypothetical protein
MTTIPAGTVYAEMRQNFPPKALQWVKDVPWTRADVPHDQIDYDDESGWGASRQPKAVRRFAREIAAGRDHLGPVIMMRRQDGTKLVVLDGHHRTLAYRRLGRPVPAYIGDVPPDLVTEAEATHNRQVHSGSSPLNKRTAKKARKRAVNWAVKARLAGVANHGITADVLPLCEAIETLQNHLKAKDKIIAGWENAARRSGDLAPLIAQVNMLGASAPGFTAGLPRPNGDRHAAW